MASKKQIAANRRNAKKSTGPKTPEGKARSSQNAISHGLCSREVLLKEEDPDRFREVWMGVMEDLRPQGEVETYLACRVASGIWRMNRVLRIEAQLFNASPQRLANPGVTLGEIFKSAGLNGGNPFGKLMRHESAIDRGIQRALQELRAVQAGRAAHEERVAEDVSEALYRKKMEDAMFGRGGAADGRASSPAGRDLQNEPNPEGFPPTPPLPPRGGGSPRTGSEGAGAEGAGAASQGGGSPRTGSEGAGAEGAGADPQQAEIQNEADPASGPAGARACGANGSGKPHGAEREPEGPLNGSGRPS